MQKQTLKPIDLSKKLLPYENKWVARSYIKINLIGPKGSRVGYALIDSGVMAILGQDGFFDAFRIKFERDHGIVEINPVR